MIAVSEQEIKIAKKVFLQIHKNDVARASQGLCRGVRDLIGYVREGIEPKWAAHRAEVLYKAYLSFGNDEITAFQDFFDERKIKAHTRTM